MGSTSITAGETVAPTSPAEAPPAFVVREGVSTVATTTGGEAALPSVAPCGGVAVRASSASASPTTCGSGDLVREGEDGVPCPPCGLVTGLHKSPATSLDPEPDTQNKHTTRSGPPRAVTTTYFAGAEYIARLLLAPGS
jgi:hypothetical protein